MGINRKAGPAEGQRAVQQAWDRGLAVLREGWAVFLPGEDVCCPCRRPDGRPCGGFLRDVPPWGQAHARPWVNWGGPERRHLPRPTPSTSRCGHCGSKTEVEIHDAGRPETPLEGAA